MIQIEDAFKTEGSSVYSHFQRPGVGFYIPLYQREYSWDVENVKQLIDDIARGVETLCEEDNEIRFLGTIITVRETDLSKIDPQEPKGLPQTIEIIIDGQQRLSTLVLFASQLYLVILEHEAALNRLGQYFEELEEVCEFWKSKIQEIFSFNLGVGAHRIKPKIIRGQADKWIKEGNIDDAYNSPEAHYIAQFIQFLEKNKINPLYNEVVAFPKNKVGKNIKVIKNWLSGTVAKAHTDDSEFPSAETILRGINQKHIWNYRRDELKAVVSQADTNRPRNASYHVCSLVQLFSVAYYVLERCCFTVIKPIDDKWAFDMFQSLNATGTPLTAIETFKPLVVNTLEKKESKVFKNSVDSIFFSKVEALFSNSKTASEKNKVTSDFITSFALVTDAENEGQKLPSYFSAQRGWLTKIYSEKIPKKFSEEQEAQQVLDMQHAFVKYLGQYAEFYKSIWIDYPLGANTVLPLLAGHKDAEIASVILLFLKESNHRMALSILSQFYMAILNANESNKAAHTTDFIESCRALGAFYTIWRSAQSNSKLDAKYRAFFKGSDTLETYAWLQREEKPAIDKLKQYLVQVLTGEELLDKEVWLRNAKSFLNYKSRIMVKFILLLYSHDTIEDKNNIGLATLGVPNSNPYLSVANWTSPDLETVEHVAPVKQSFGWDTAIYSDNTFNSVGNLILLPANVNTSASNRGWVEKLVYYKHIGENDPSVLAGLAEQASLEGIILADNPSTLKILRGVTHQKPMSVVISMEGKQEWNRKFIEARTERVLDIAWERLSEWLK